MRPRGTPLYLQIAQILLGEIHNNCSAGDRLESEDKLASRFKVNRHTMRHAIDELVEQGYLERRRGLGVFVVEHPLRYELHKETRLTTNLMQMGVSGDRTFFRRQVMPASAETASFLEIKKGQKVAVLESLVHANNAPFCISTHHFIHAQHKEIYDLFTDGSLHEFISRTYNIKLRRKSSTINALLSSSDEAALLRIGINRPLLQVQTVNVEVKTGVPVEYVVSRYPAKRVELFINF